MRSASVTASSMLCVTIRTARVGIDRSAHSSCSSCRRFSAGEHVERGERLVEEEHLGMHDQRAREADALLHPAGQLLGERFLVARRGRSGRSPVRRARVARQPRDWWPAVPARRCRAPSARETTQSSGTRSATCGFGSVERHATNQHATFGRRHEPGQDSEQRRFARTRRPEQRDELAVAELDVDVVQHRRPVVAVVLPHVLRREQYLPPAGDGAGGGGRSAGSTM